MYGLTIVGVLLMLGLFTRLAAAGGIGFILLFYLCNPPFIGYFYAIPTEGTLPDRQQEPRGALCPGGDSPDRDRPFCGLDGILHGLFVRLRRPRLATA